MDAIIVSLVGTWNRSNWKQLCTLQKRFTIRDSGSNVIPSCFNSLLWPYFSEPFVDKHTQTNEILKLHPCRMAGHFQTKYLSDKFYHTIQSLCSWLYVPWTRLVIRHITSTEVTPYRSFRHFLWNVHLIHPLTAWFWNITCHRNWDFYFRMNFIPFLLSSNMSLVRAKHGPI